MAPFQRVHDFIIILILVYPKENIQVAYFVQKPTID